MTKPINLFSLLFTPCDFLHTKHAAFLESQNHMARSVKKTASLRVFGLRRQLQNKYRYHSAVISKSKGLRKEIDEYLTVRNDTLMNPYRKLD
jgi:hypothetical protein